MILKQLALGLISVSFFLFSCSRENDTENKKNKYSTEKSAITFTQGLTLKTDTLFNYDGISNYYTYNESGEEKIIVKIRNAIYEFDVSTNEIEIRWEFPTKGPNRVKGIHKLDGVVKFDNDNYLIIYHMLGEVYQARKKEGATVSFQFEPAERELKAFYNSSAVFPILNANNSKEVLLPIWNLGRLENLSNTYAFGKFNIDTKKFKEIIHYPGIYDEHHWGDHPYAYTANIQYIPEKKQYFVTFPIDPYIYIYNNEFKILGRQYVQSKFIPEINPFRQEKVSIDDEIDYMEDRKYFRAMSFYMGAYYDPSTKLYYRLARRAIENDSGGHDYQYSFIICNLDLEIIDEVTIDTDQYNIFRTFVCSKGLMLLNESKLIDESELPYDRMMVEYPL